MTDKKEMGRGVFAAMAMVVCCLLLTILLAGGGLALVGGYFNKLWIVAVGIAIIIFAVVAFIWNRRRNRKEG